MAQSIPTNKTVVFQSDFGRVDGAVAAMYGVANSVAPDLKLYDLTHEIPPFDIWQASYRLIQTVEYWAPGTVFVSVVDPGVGTNRKSVVILTKTGHFVVTPDNGTLTHIKETLGIAQRREIEEALNRLKNSENSYTFHGRDIYAYTGARLAAGLIQIEDVGKELPSHEVISLKNRIPKREEGTITASIDILDMRYGSLWTNCPREIFNELKVNYGEYVNVEISHHNKLIYRSNLRYVRSFSEVNIGEPLLYINSLLKVGVALNQGNFAHAHSVGAGQDWIIKFQRQSK